MDAELKPCPFCGSAAKLHADDAVMCTNKVCDASVYFITPEHWNNRHSGGDGEDAARFERFATALGANLQPASPHAVIVAGSRYHYQYAEDLWKAWQVAARAGERGVA